MELTWSLDSLYQSFTDNKLEEDKKAFVEEIEAGIVWAEENLIKLSTKTLEEVIVRNKRVVTYYERLSNFAELSFTTNVRDEEAKKLIEFTEGSLAKWTEFSVLQKEALKNCDALEAIIETSDLLKEHKFYLLEMKDEAKRMLTRGEEVAIETMRNNGSRAWSKLQDTLTSTLEITLERDGKLEVLPLATIRNLAYDSSGITRKLAYEAELKAYEKVEESIAFALNSIKGEALAETKMRSYESILERTLEGSRLEKETLDAMLEAMKSSLGDFASYLKRKAKLLGHQGSLPFYDLFAPMGEANLRFTELEARDLILDNFYKYSDRLGNMARKAFEERWIDFNPKEGKVGGAFCSNIHSIRQSRILSNFTGSFSDVLTLAHELGHAYHGESLNESSILNSHYTMPIAETASIFCETIVKNALLAEADKESKITIIEQDISDSLQVIVDILSRFIFEDRVIKERKNGAISVGKLKEFMVEAQKEAYRDGLNEEYLHPYMWICKGHYYDAALNYYNFPYAFGLLFSKGLYAIYLEDKEAFIEKYDKMLALTGQMKIEDVADYMGIDVKSTKFWEKSLDIIKKDIELFMELTK